MFLSVVPEPGWCWAWGRDQRDSHGPVLIKPLPQDRGTAIAGLCGEVGVGARGCPGRGPSPDFLDKGAAKPERTKGRKQHNVDVRNRLGKGPAVWKERRRSIWGENCL